jgi:hypothetical protein
MNPENTTRAALTILRDAKPLLNRQQYKTLRGQILAGDPRGAVKGLGKILRRRQDTPTDLIRRAVVDDVPGK